MERGISGSFTGQWDMSLVNDMYFLIFNILNIFPKLIQFVTNYSLGLSYPTKLFSYVETFKSSSQRYLPFRNLPLKLK